MRLVVLAGLVAAGLAQINTNEPVKASLCDVVKEPQRFNGELLQIPCRFVSKFHWTGLVDDSCGARLPIGVYHVLDSLKRSDGEYAFTTVSDDMTHPERLKWKPILSPKPIHVIKDEGYRILQKYADAKFRWKDGGTCADCPLYRITATAVGRFDYFETQTVAVRLNPQSRAFSNSAGEPNAPLLRFVLQRVSDVSATPIDTSAYSKSKRRAVSLEEATDLVYAYLKSIGCKRGACVLEPSHPPSSDFFGFQALNSNPGRGLNLGFFDVDKRTGDVWSGVVCEKFSSPELAILERTIRRRIGLTQEEYRRNPSRGLLCEPGEKPR